MRSAWPSTPIPRRGRPGGHVAVRSVPGRSQTFGRVRVHGEGPQSAAGPPRDQRRACHHRISSVTAPLPSLLAAPFKNSPGTSRPCRTARFPSRRTVSMHRLSQRDGCLGRRFPLLSTWSSSRNWGYWNAAQGALPTRRPRNLLGQGSFCVAQHCGDAVPALRPTKSPGRRRRRPCSHCSTLVEPPTFIA